MRPGLCRASTDTLAGRVVAEWANALKGTPIVKVSIVRKIVVKVTSRGSDDAKYARLEFPDKDYLHQIFLVSALQDLSNYKFHHYNNILVSENYSPEVEEFLKKAAERVGFTLEFEK